MKTFTSEIDITNAAEAFDKVHHLPYSLFIDSADQSHQNSRYSYILCNPLETIESKGDQITIISREKLSTLRNQSPFKVLQDRLDSYDFGTDTVAGLPPFQGGLAGLFGYDLGRALETMPSIAIDDPDMPDMAVGLYDQVIAFDHAQNQTWIITHARTELEAQMKEAVLMNNISAPRRVPINFNPDVNWTAQFKPAAFKQRIEKVRDYVLQGDIFQANIAQKFKSTLPAYFSPYAHYMHMRQQTPAPFATYMNCGSIKISSCSPERFLTVDTENQVETKPIKGTAPRSDNPQKDAHNKEKLSRSGKDKAENIMITDLLRSDLSKVCDIHSVHVEELCALESFKNVHHLVSTISGKLDTGKTPLNTLEACFPGGSVTGAPKIRAMEIIEELEPTRRGPYCGSIAMIGFNGTLDSNILIRTLVYDNNTVSFQVGGGITAASDPDDEHQETLDKAAGIFESFDTLAKTQLLSA